MKKLSLIVALAVVLTIGGVFATWTYPGATVAPDSETIGVTIESATSGADTFNVNNTMAISVDPTSNTDYTAKITKSGNIVITLDPATGSRVAAGETTVVAKLKKGDAKAVKAKLAVTVVAKEEEKVEDAEETDEKEEKKED